MAYLGVQRTPVAAWERDLREMLSVARDARGRGHKRPAPSPSSQQIPLFVLSKFHQHPSPPGWCRPPSKMETWSRPPPPALGARRWLVGRVTGQVQETSTLAGPARVQPGDVHFSWEYCHSLSYIPRPEWHEWTQITLIKNITVETNAGEVSVVGTDRIVGLRNAFHEQSLFDGQGMQHCACRAITKQITTKRCKYRKTRALCTSRCHMSLPCTKK